MAKKRSKKPTPKASQKKATPKSSERKPSPLSNMSPGLRNGLLHGGLLLGFFVILLIYFSPLLSGEKLQMGDIQQFSGMTKQAKEYNAETGEQAFWTSRMFGGMPTTHAGLQFPKNIIKNLYTTYFKLVPPPISFLFLMFLSFYVLLNTMKLGPWFSFIGGAAFAFSSYFFIIMAAGHTSKAAAIGFLPLTVAGILMIYDNKWLLGGVLTAFSMAFGVAANHVQITYYMAIMVAVIGIFLFVEAIREGKFAPFAKSTGIALLAVGLGIAPNIGHLYSSYEYVQETIRGKSELTPKDGTKKDEGLDMGYAFDWSYEIHETFTLLVPNFMGGASGTTFEPGSKNYDVVKKKLGAQSARGAMPTFWGKPIFTSGPVYVGAIICFLFLLGAILVKGPLKWGLIAATVLFMMFSWGGNFLAFNEFIFNTVPLYNKFRAVSMALVIPEFTMPLLGLLGLVAAIQYKDRGIEKAEVNRAIYIAAGVTGGLCLLLALVGPGLFSFSGYSDERYLTQQNGQQIVDIFIELRQNMLVSDSWRSFGLIAIATALLWAFVNDRIKQSSVVLALLAILIVGDMWLVNKRYINDDNFSRRENYESPQPSLADQQILRDNTHFRVLNMTVNSFNSANTAFFHNDIGGYHPAKLRRYNDLMYGYVAPNASEGSEMRTISMIAQQTQGQQPGAVDFRRLPILNMLNCKYIILSPQIAWRNPMAMGNAWFVQSYKMVENADEEFAALKDLNPRLEAVLDKRYADVLNGIQPGIDSTAYIRQTSFTPNEVSYISESSTDQLAIFSEVFYNSSKGWKAYVDGVEVPHARANYVLRALPLKAGKHEITFRINPESYYVGENISMISSIILILLGLAAGFFVWRNRSNKEEEIA